MIEINKNYRSFDALKLALAASPVCMVSDIFLSVTQSIMQTGALALVTAEFVDTASAILKGVRPHNDIYLPLVLLLVTLGLTTIIGALIQLASSRIRLNLKRRLVPSVVKVYAALDYNWGFT